MFLRSAWVTHKSGTLKQVESVKVVVLEVEIELRLFNAVKFWEVRLVASIVTFKPKQSSVILNRDSSYLLLHSS